MIFYFLAKSITNPAKQQKISAKLARLLQIYQSKIKLETCYLIHFKTKPSDQTLKKIANIISAKKYQIIEKLDFNNRVMNLPRFGTQSPFSSKAYDILTICGFDIEQIEQASLWSFNQANFEELKQDPQIRKEVDSLIGDLMTHQSIWKNQINSFFEKKEKESFKTIDILNQGRAELEKFNLIQGLALSKQDINYLVSAYKQMNKNPSDVELMMFSAINSEHCRHKIFNAEFTLDNKKQELSLFHMIKNTAKKSFKEIITAYSDNSSIIKGTRVNYFHRSENGIYKTSTENQAILMKVETHNHPTVISPFAGAATGSGGEIRDEGATGRGGKPIAGLSGFSVSNLHLPEYPQVWEQSYDYEPNYPENMADSLQIMIDGPIGSASYNNEFGRANLAGYFRSFEYLDVNSKRWGYHKPIMIAGGMGQILAQNFKKEILTSGNLVIVLGPASLKIGIGGGSASSTSLSSKKDNILDFSSVQRDNPEAQRRAQEVINQCIDLKEKNPILSIHDVGAGGLSNAIPELIFDNDLGADLDFNKIAINDLSMNPLEIWCNESQERYVLAIAKNSLPFFEKICKKERCLFQILGKTNESQRLTLKDNHFKNNPVDIHLDWLFAKPLKLQIEDNFPTKNIEDDSINLDFNQLDLAQSITQVLSHPSVASKAFLIHISDRTVGGKTVQDQMVGQFQVPIADCAISFNDFQNFTGSAMSMGERPALALIDAVASARIAVAEAILNLAGADIDFKTIALSANWMADCSDKENKEPNNNENAKLFQAVKALGMEFCPKLSIAIPVGKDSLSMKMIWQDNKKEDKKRQKTYQVTAPISVNISAFAKVKDVRKTLTPELKNTNELTQILKISIAKNSKELSLAGSIFLQTHNLIGSNSIDVKAQDLNNFLTAFTLAKENNYLLAYHDISDGGLLTALVEMQLTTRQSIEAHLPYFEQAKESYQFLFSEAPSVLVQVNSQNSKKVMELFTSFGLNIQKVAKVQSLLVCHQEKFEIVQSDAAGNERIIFAATRVDLEQTFSKVSYHIKRMRDNPKLADDEQQNISSNQSQLFSELTFNSAQLGKLKEIPHYLKNKPKVAILREQGVNGYLEMAYAFHLAGFECSDIHMSELLAGSVKLQDFKGIAFPGGFSYGDTFGAATGWASSILYNPNLLTQFEEFFKQKSSFGLGICNGSQVLSKLKNIIPGADHWPNFKHNDSYQFEARVVMSEVLESPSIFLKDMVGSFIPVVVSHAEGKAEFQNHDFKLSEENKLLALRYVNFDKTPAKDYPMNPNGSTGSIAGLTNLDGRFTIMMPHPERTLRSIQFPFQSTALNHSEFSPWLKIFENARRFIE